MKKKSLLFLVMILFAATAWAEAENPEPRILELITALENDFNGARDKDLRNRLGQELDSFGDKAVPVLVEVFTESGEPLKKTIALTSLTHILKEKSVGYLLEGLEDHDAEVRLETVYLVSSFRTPETYEALVKMVETETDEAVIKLALWTIAGFRNPQAMDFLTQKLRDMDPKKRDAAVGVFKNLFFN
jgi:HEAT repeat protein